MAKNAKVFLVLPQRAFELKDVRLVRATSAARASAHLVATTFAIEEASPESLLDAGAAGVAIEDAKGG